MQWELARLKLTLALALTLFTGVLPGLNRSVSAHEAKLVRAFSRLLWTGAVLGPFKGQKEQKRTVGG